jgi:ABC-type nitrate/sulfonate/bicarbonate transport system permease component
VSAGAKRIPAGLVSTLVALIVWQVATLVGPLANSSVPSATSTLARLWEMLFISETWSSIWLTVQMALIGLAISIVIAIPLGILIGLSRFAFFSTKFTFDFFKVIPPIVIIPITILVFGPTQEMGIFLVVFALVFALAIQTAYGVRDTDPVLVETMRCYGLGRVKQVFYARLPAAMPFIAVGIRISAAAAMIVAVVAGLVGGAPGLGRDLLLSQASGENTETFAIVVILGILGLAVSRLVVFLQRRLIFWTAS